MEVIQHHLTDNGTIVEKAELKCIEVKTAPEVLKVFSRINQQTIRPRLEKVLDDYEKLHNISKPNTDKDEPVGNGASCNNK